MKEFIITGILIVVAVYLVSTFILGASGTATMQGQSARIGGAAITRMQSVTP